MRVLSVQPRNIVAVLELDIMQIGMVLDFLDNCKMEYNSKENPQLVSADKYVKETFFKTLDGIYEEFGGGKKEDGSGSDSSGE